MTPVRRLLFAGCTMAMAATAMAAAIPDPTDGADDAVEARDPAPPEIAGDTDGAQQGATPTPMAGLRTAPLAGGFAAFVDNHLAGPVEVELDFIRNRGMQATPSLPARLLVPAHGSLAAVRLAAADPASGGDFELRIRAVPGDPRARAVDVDYLLPLQAFPGRIEQGFGGSFSHDDDENRYAIDLAASPGTVVLAARDGVVMQVEHGFTAAGIDRGRFGGRANVVRLLHDDGAMSVYAHLMPDGVLVQPGQRVQAGQPIARTGDTGFSTGPHLHFAVQVNRGMRLVSIPFRMRGPAGPLRLRGN